MIVKLNFLKTLCFIKGIITRFTENKIKLTTMNVICSECKKITKINCEFFYDPITINTYVRTFHQVGKNCLSTNIKVINKLSKFSQEIMFKIFVSQLSNNNQSYLLLDGFVESHNFIKDYDGSLVTILGLLDIRKKIISDIKGNAENSNNKYKLYFKVLSKINNDEMVNKSTIKLKKYYWKKFKKISKKPTLLEKLSSFIAVDLKSFDYVKKLVLALLIDKKYKINNHIKLLDSNYLKVLIRADSSIRKHLWDSIKFFFDINDDSLEFFQSKVNKSKPLFETTQILLKLKKTGVLFITEENYLQMNKIFSISNILEHDLFVSCIGQIISSFLTSIIVLENLKPEIIRKNLYEKDFFQANEITNSYNIFFNINMNSLEKNIHYLNNINIYFSIIEKILKNQRTLEINHIMFLKNYLHANRFFIPAPVSLKIINFIIIQLKKMRSKNFSLGTNFYLSINVILSLALNISKIHMKKYLNKDLVNRSLYIYCFNDFKFKLQYSVLPDISNKKQKVYDRIIHTLIASTISKYKIVSINKLFYSFKSLGISISSFYYSLWLFLVKKKGVLIGNYLKSINNANN